MGEHVVERHYGDGEDEHDPEQATELSDVVSVAAMPVIVTAMARLRVVTMVARGLDVLLVVGVMAGMRVGLVVVRMVVCRG
ncbi:hypothetical protein [Amycolatopsis marina]|uniref:hypothetical protein n=1 Tax=Amycolatopsis marina TaxID=490629 RepID=UPI001FE833E1|nr:hypothetical protein [Amycolatopsis marina]